MKATLAESIETRDKGSLWFVSEQSILSYRLFSNCVVHLVPDKLTPPSQYGHFHNTSNDLCLFTVLVKRSPLLTVL